MFIHELFLFFIYIYYSYNRIFIPNIYGVESQELSIILLEELRVNSLILLTKLS